MASRRDLQVKSQRLAGSALGADTVIPKLRCDRAHPQPRPSAFNASFKETISTSNLHRVAFDLLLTATVELL